MVWNCMRIRRSWLAVVILLTAAVVSQGCGDDEKACTSTYDFQPRLSPVSFGELYPLDDDGDGTPDHEANPGSNERVPFEWVELLDVPCGGSITISEVCLVGPQSAIDQYIVEGPIPSMATGSDPAAIRITYNRLQPNDAIDDVMLVVQSDSKDVPTMIVPICARVIPSAQEKNPDMECAEPDLDVAIGDKVDTQTLAGDLAVVCTK